MISEHNIIKKQADIMFLPQNTLKISRPPIRVNPYYGLYHEYREY